MSIFKQFWKDMSAMIADEKEGEAEYRAIGDKFHEMADDEAKHKETLEEMKSKSSIDIYPEDMHQFKVGEEVEYENRKGKIVEANVGVVAVQFYDTGSIQQLSLGGLISQNMKSMGIEGAGPIPKSKLAEQDLETSKADIITTTQEKLEDIGDKAEEAKTADEKNGIINQIKSVQEKRQKAAIKMRKLEEVTSKAFKSFWNINRK